VPAGSLAYRRAIGHVPFGAVKGREAPGGGRGEPGRRAVPGARPGPGGEPGGYGDGADPSAPDPTQVRPRGPRERS